MNAFSISTSLMICEAAIVEEIQPEGQKMADVVKGMLGL